MLKLSFLSWRSCLDKNYRSACYYTNHFCLFFISSLVLSIGVLCFLATCKSACSNSMDLLKLEHYTLTLYIYYFQCYFFLFLSSKIYFFIVFDYLKLLRIFFAFYKKYCHYHFLYMSK